MRYRADERLRTAIRLAALTALAMVLAYLESLLPPLPGIPGFRIGLPNLVVLAVLYRAGAWQALTVNGVRIVLSALLFGSPVTFLYALAGAALSFAVMWLMKKAGVFAVPAVSAAGGAAHNLGQLTAARLLLGSGAVWSLLPVLWIVGTISGALIGVLAWLINEKLPRKLL